MARGTLLLAGPVVLDVLDHGSPLLSGDGALAAMAAAALVPTQLWARAGTDLPQAAWEVLRRRRVDSSGLITDGLCHRRELATAALQRHGSDLPDEEPGDPEELACCAAVGLQSGELRRALDCFRALPRADHRLHCIGLIGDDPHLVEACAGRADLLVLSARQACAGTGSADPLVAAGRLIGAGCTAVALTAGPFGGLLRYKNKCTTWPADPITPKDDHGALAVFTGCLVGALCEHGQIDWRVLKRACWTASAVAAASLREYGPRRLLQYDRSGYQELFNRLRRNGKA